mmetsp:Transcript_108869/g.302702  ORF Transcript_108869/g.302702 Transcript_108869/m.302702 type:complete len:275 (-) Transcript_108869:123-947(-)
MSYRTLIASILCASNPFRAVDELTQGFRYDAMRPQQMRRQRGVPFCKRSCHHIGLRAAFEMRRAGKAHAIARGHQGQHQRMGADALGDRRPHACGAEQMFPLLVATVAHLRVAQHQRILHHFLQRNFLVCQQWVPRRQGHQERVAPQRHRHDLAFHVSDRRKAGVEEARSEPVQELRQRHFGQPDADLRRLLAAQRKQRRQTRAPDVARQPDAQRAVIARRDGPRAGLRLLAGQHHTPGIFQEYLPGCGQTHAASVAVEQGHAKVGFQATDPAR